MRYFICVLYINNRSYSCEEFEDLRYCPVDPDGHFDAKCPG